MGNGVSRRGQTTHNAQTDIATYSRGWREPGNKTLQKGRIFSLVLFKKRVPDQEGRPAGQRQLGAGAGKRFLVLFRIIEQGQELIQKS